jgi:hypothetical protein
MSHVYSAWASNTDPDDAPEYQLSPRATAYLIEIDGKYFRVRVPEEHSAPDPAPKTPAPAPKSPIGPHADILAEHSAKK